MSNCKRCDGVTRRDFLRVGGLSALGLGLGDYFHVQRAMAAENTLAPTAKSCILIWLDGGPSHLEMFDPKPDAPSEVRGPFETIPTTLPGIRFGECLEQVAKLKPFQKIRIKKVSLILNTAARVALLELVDAAKHLLQAFLRPEDGGVIHHLLLQLGTNLRHRFTLA